MVGSMTLAGGASAEPIENVEYRDGFTEIVDDFCGVSGLTVQLERVIDGRILVNPHGPDGLAYFLDSHRFTTVFTNLDNGNTVNEVGNFTVKDLRVTDNGDGTLTLLILDTGNATLYGPDGGAIARNPGQIQYEWLVDHRGTPTNPFDDEFLEFGVVKEPTGKNDDFCAAIESALVD
jgi:hypothetical protein